MGNGVQGYGVHGMPHGQWGTGAMGTRGYGSHGQWGTGAMGTGGMDHMGNGAHSTIGYRGYGLHGQWGHMGQ